MSVSSIAPLPPPATGPSRSQAGPGPSFAAPSRSGAPPTYVTGPAAEGLAGVHAVLLNAMPPGLDRRRGLERGRLLLTLLGRVQVALLDATEGDAAAGLRAALRQALEPAAEPELAAILADIELRAAVEAAKREIDGRRADP